jgi:hypothetical protein
MTTSSRGFVYDEPSYPLIEQSSNFDTKGNLMKGPAYNKKFADGKEGRPNGFTFLLPEGFQSEAHFHTECQFQVALDGEMEFPNHPISAIGVHYTDANTAYGPFVCKTKCYGATLRPRRTSTSLRMAYKENRKVRNPYGREFVGVAEAVPWEDLSGDPGARRKVIFGGDGGPAAHLYQYAPGVKVDLPPAPHGQWQILVGGGARIGADDLKPYSMRYIVGTDQPSAFIAGLQGVTWLFLTYDEAADKSGTFPDASSPDLIQKGY